MIVTNGELFIYILTFTNLGHLERNTSFFSFILKNFGPDHLQYV